MTQSLQTRFAQTHPRAAHPSSATQRLCRLAREKVTWVVGLDGSTLSFRCLRLAEMMMKLDGSHNLLVLNLVEEGEEEKRSLMVQAEEECRRAGVFTLKHFGTKTLTIPEGWDLISTLVYFANHAGGFRCRLVVGAMGMTYEDTPKMDKIGHVAATCLAKVKVRPLVMKSLAARPHGRRRGPLT